jgi:cytochrome c oxidase cbb3-type subunit 3
MRDERNMMRLFVALIFVASLAFVACEREKREVRQNPPGAMPQTISVSDLQPGTSGVAAVTKNPAEEHAYDLSQGKQLYQYYNCAGCHFNGGGGIGPPLMDDTWIYGSDPANIYATITEGRPNGMPSFRQKVPDAQVWQLVGYVRSLSGQVQKDVSPTRSDHMETGPSEQRTQAMKPKDSGPPPEIK